MLVMIQETSVSAPGAVDRGLSEYWVAIAIDTSAQNKLIAALSQSQPQEPRHHTVFSLTDILGVYKQPRCRYSSNSLSPKVCRDYRRLGWYDHEYFLVCWGS